MARNLGPVKYSEEDTYSSYEETGSPSPGGSTSLEGLTDVDISNPADGQTLVYDAASEKWINGSAGSGVLVVKTSFSGNTYTLDKTFAQIYDAMASNGVVVLDETLEDELVVSADITPVSGVYKESGVYEVYLRGATTYSADSEDGYPSYVVPD